MRIQSILAAGLLMMFGACTDLSETLYDKIDATYKVIHIEQE